MTEFHAKLPAAMAMAAKRTTTIWSVDYAKSDRCQCRYSGDPIELGEMRIVKETISHEGFRMAYSYKVAPAFQLMARMAATTSRPKSAAELHGYARIPEPDQQNLTILFDRFHSLGDDDPPLPSYSRAAQKERRFKRPRADERRFVCPAPGCPKAYASTGCLSRHKKEMHPELIGQKGEKPPRMRYPALTSLPCPAAPDPAAPDPAAADPAPSPACPPSLTPCAIAKEVPLHSTLVSADPWAVDPLHLPFHLPAVAYPPPAQPAPPVSADSATRRHVCPAPGCIKAYNSAHCLYVHKRNHHPELIAQRTRRP